MSEIEIVIITAVGFFTLGLLIGGLVAAGIMHWGKQ